MDDELSNAVAFVDLDVLLGVEVDEDDFELSSVVGVDETRSVDYGQTLLKGWTKPA